MKKIKVWWMTGSEQWMANCQCCNENLMPVTFIDHFSFDEVTLVVEAHIFFHQQQAYEPIKRRKLKVEYK